MADSRGNTGSRNTGNWNTGNWNTGSWNTGSRNTGNLNTGNWNTGSWNTGSRNTGSRNTGSRNAGDRNTGDRNTGDRNTGDRNTGSWNTGDYCTGFFNTEDFKAGAFNGAPFASTKERDAFTAACPAFFWAPRPLDWVSSDKMTDAEKAEHPKHETTGGFLRENDIEEKWQSAWNNASDEDRDKCRKLLDDYNGHEVFKEITGLDVATEPCECEELVINGKRYVLAGDAA